MSKQSNQRYRKELEKKNTDQSGSNNTSNASINQTSKDNAKNIKNTKIK